MEDSTLDRRPRVLFVIDGLGPGGAERQARLLLVGLPKDRVSIRLACFGGDPGELAKVAEAEVGIDRLPHSPRRLWPMRTLWRLSRIVRRERIDIVQSFLPTFDILAPCLRLFVPRLRVVTSRRNVVEQLAPRQLQLLRWTNRLATVVVANSEAVGESVRRIEKGGRFGLRVIPNGIVIPDAVTMDEWAEARSRFGIDADDFVVSYVAHFRDGKGHNRLPRLIADLLQRVPRARFLLAGDMESNRSYRRNASTFRTAIEGLGIAQRVHCLGRLDGSRPVLAASDVVLNLSDVEGMSNALMEAMALGIPVVASDAGGAREIIREGREGWIVEPDDSAAVVSRLEQLAVNTNLGREVGSAGRKRMMAEFSVERMACAYAELYEELI